MDQTELQTIVEKHKRWLLNMADGARANLSRANLSRADLSGANLSGADLSGANLCETKGLTDYAANTTTILPDGDLIGWKRCLGNVIVKLLIPAAARRSNATGRKCRAEYAVVLEVIGADQGKSVYSDKPPVIYRAGETVRADLWDENRWEECSGGIHFYITRWEAENY